ncbi:MAG: hypothetical protein AVDCRST_MAG34-1814 [uncultured Nocardioidaceae bacterium]|uniref:Uncharacterized protein n=1 Tax=uncultured Nocardioidaceae bacterium TaxID=253824 RepID=A0A6J4M977_9ACTN|nr:MAG: hypothetical protein AVDCRST_MAG34-1814 [uncultured Nocardioidaceae bacterium]
MRQQQRGRPPAGGRVRRHVTEEPPMFVFFSNRLGCGGSLLVSIVITVILVLIFTR